MHNHKGSIGGLKEVNTIRLSPVFPLPPHHHLILIFSPYVHFPSLTQELLTSNTHTILLLTRFDNLADEIRSSDRIPFLDQDTANLSSMGCGDDHFLGTVLARCSLERM